MMKTILFTATFMTLAFAGFATTSAYAHCDDCKSHKSGTKKPYEIFFNE